MNTTVAALESSLPTIAPRVRQMAGLYALKPWFTGRLTPIVILAVARGISPDAFTAAGVVAAGAAAVSIAFGCWPLAAVFLVLRLAGANLDGAVARAAGKSRPWGFVVNEIGDRASDLLAFAGLAVFVARHDGSGMHWLSWPVLQVLLAALAATMPTFASLAAAAAGAQRRNGGPMGKTERCLFMVLATVFPVIMPVLLMQLVNGSLITTVLRLRATRRELAAKQEEEQRNHFEASEATGNSFEASEATGNSFEASEATGNHFEASEATGNHFVEYFDAVTQPLYAVTQPLTPVTRPLIGVAA